MITFAEAHKESFELSSQETQMAHEAGQAMVGFASGDNCLRLTLARETGEQIEAKVPAIAVKLLAQILGEIAKGNPIAFIPMHAELSTIQAAEVMRVSRPHLVKLLEAGQIPFRLVGAHRRVRYDDVVAYLEEEKRKRKEVLTEMMAEQERLGLYE